MEVIESVCEGGLLADDMGTGKTFTVIQFLSKTQALPTLVLSPASMVPVWFERLRRHLRGPRVVCASMEAFQPRSPGPTVMLCSYNNIDLLRKMCRSDWHRVIIDEAQGLKNSAIARASPVHRLAWNAHKRWLLTGTPWENCYRDFRNLMTLVAPDQGAADFMRSRVIMRSREEIARDYPMHFRVSDPRVQVWKVPMCIAEEVTLSKHLHAQVTDSCCETECVVSILRCRQVCVHRSLMDTSVGNMDSSKIRGMIHVLQLDMSKTVIFTSFTSGIPMIRQAIHDRLSRKTLVLDGSCPPREKLRVLSEFAYGDASVLVANIQAGGVGLDIHAARVVIILEPQWNPSHEIQAIGRVVRKGQLGSVTVHKLVSVYDTGFIPGPWYRNQHNISAAIADGRCTVEQAIIFKQRDKIRQWKDFVNMIFPGKAFLSVAENLFNY
jgi:SNF2 family DNA or RNA helicase